MELIINDVKLEGDLMDADFMEKFEQSMIKMRDTAQAKKRENFPDPLRPTTAPSVRWSMRALTRFSAPGRPTGSSTAR